MATEKTASEPNKTPSPESGMEFCFYDGVEEVHLTREQIKKRLEKHHSFANRVRELAATSLSIDAAECEKDIIAILRKELEWSEFCFLAILSESRQCYVVHTLTSLADSTSLDGKVFEVDDGMPGQVISRKSPRLTNIELCPPFPDEIASALQDLGMKRILVVPLQTSGDTIGALVMCRNDEKWGGEDEICLAQLIALHTAIALRHLSLFDDAGKRFTQMKLVNEIAEKLTGTLELDQLLASAADAIRKTCNYFDVTIFMAEEKSNELILVAHSGNYDDFLPNGYRQPITEGLVGWAATKGERVLVNDVSRDDRYLAYEYHNTQSELAVPIRVKGKVVGVVNVEETSRVFDEMDAIVLETVSAQLGSVIGNAQLFARVKEANTTLTELDKMKSDFLGIVSHDFRGPLASIILAARSLSKRGSALDEIRQKEYLGIIINEAEKLRQLAEDTLSITRLESGQLSYRFELVNVERLFKDAIALVSPSRRHRIESSVHSDAAYIKGDKVKLGQLLRNLISNAVKYSPQGGVVYLKAEPDSSGKVLVSVSDEGIGIPPEQLGRLFKKFSRISSEEAKDIPGSGLGLWICQEIVRGHGGSIWVESQRGKGSTFRLTLIADHDGNHRPS